MARHVLILDKAVRGWGWGGQGRKGKNLGLVRVGTEEGLWVAFLCSPGHGLPEGDGVGRQSLWEESWSLG